MDIVMQIITGVPHHLWMCYMCMLMHVHFDSTHHGLQFLILV